MYLLEVYHNYLTVQGYLKGNAYIATQGMNVYL